MIISPSVEAPWQDTDSSRLVRLLGEAEPCLKGKKNDNQLTAQAQLKSELELKERAVG